MRAPWIVLIVLVSGLGTTRAADATFTAQPAAVRKGDQVAITFAVSASTDVEVAILDAKGAVVRHLAAGLLGTNAPAPLQKGTLSQSLAWDGKDDAGNAVPAGAGPLSARVTLGARPRLDRHLGWDGNTTGLNIAALGVGQDGELLVLESEGGWGYSTLRAYTKEGKYARTIFPSPAGTPKERAAPFGQLEVDGSRIPMVFNAHGGNTTPLTSGMKAQNIIRDAAGNIVLASAVGSMPEHGPARYLMAFDPRGGAAAGIPFPGPQIGKSRGFIGGAGERDRRMFDYLATSPDRKTIYFVHVDLGQKAPPCAVYRTTWADKEFGAPFLGKEGQPGAGDDQFADVRGVATDAKGNLYVCDQGNNRVMIFGADGTFRGKFAVEKPEQIQVHPKTGEIYLLCKGRDAKRADNWGPTDALIKFAAFDKEAPKELARLAKKPIGIIALDPESSPARLWVTLSTGYSSPPAIAPVVETGSSFEVGAAINLGPGLHYPMFTAADPARNRVLVRERGRWQELVTIDTATDKRGVLPVPGSDIAVDRSGNIYVMDGRNFGFGLTRFTPDGKPAPFASTGKHKLAIGGYRDYGVELGLRGHCLAPNGDLYVIRSSNVGEGVGKGIPAVVDVFGPDGAPKKTPLINNMGHGDCGLGVDAAGSVYLGANLRDKAKPYPDWAMGQVPATGWVWWKAPREGLWNLPYYNPYLYHWGSIFKFGPEGGAFYGNAIPGAQPVLPVAGAPADAMSLWSGYLAKEVKVAGAKWRYAGFGPVPTSDVNWGDPACICMTSRLAADEYGRVYVPDPFRFTVHMLDTAGNLITEIGTYGNMDDAGPTISFCWPAFVCEAGGRIYVTDSNNRRVTAVRFDHAAEATCDVK